MVVPGGVDVSMIMTGAEIKKQGPSWKLKKKEEEIPFGSSSGEL